MNLNYHIHENELKCPYCDNVQEYSENILEAEFEEEIEIECEFCEKNFWASKNIVFNSYSDCALNNEQHDMIAEFKGHPTIFSCKNCYQHEIRPEAKKT